MADLKNPYAPADDRFERYYTEKLWSWIPEIYRTEDGVASPPGVLRAVVEILAGQAAIARRSVDRLWEDAFIETGDDWVIPYIADLVGTRLGNELNRRGRRVDVARTIHYRRRKGTRNLLERLVPDITGWSGVVVESFRTLARTRHGLDPEPLPLIGLVTGTPPGGLADLREARGAEQAGGPFDEYFHTPDFRRLRGALGRYGISKLNIHLYRLIAHEVVRATPASFGDRRFTFDPSGRDIALFHPARRASGECRTARAWEVAAPMPCRLLGAARYRVGEELVDALEADGMPAAAGAALRRYVGETFANEARLRATLASLPEAALLLAHIDAILARAITGDSPKVHLYPGAVAVAIGEDEDAPPTPRQRVVAGALETWGAGLTLAPEKELVIDPERGRFLLTRDLPGAVWVPSYHYGFSGDIGAGTYDRRADLIEEGISRLPGDQTTPGPIPLTVPSTGAHEIGSSKTHLPDGDVTGIESLVLQAANLERPYLLRLAPGPTPAWIWSALPKAPVAPGGEEPPENLRTLTLEGLWIGVADPDAAPAPAPCPPLPADLVIDGIFDRVVIRHCTLDPGGEKARLAPDQCEAIRYVRLLVRGVVEELVIESSIVGPIGEAVVGGERGRISKLTLRDSIVHAIDPAAGPAIDTELGDVDMRRVTVIGDVRADGLEASEAIVQGVVHITDTQHGCFRFGATGREGARLPPVFQSYLVDTTVPNRWFVSRRFGDAGYMQLSSAAPEEVLRGAENRSEMGAFSDLLSPIELADLEAKVGELMPFGRIPQFISET